MLIILPYKNGSKSVAELKKAAVGVELKLENSRFKGAARKKVVNWGASTPHPEAAKCQVLNSFEAVKIASNKLRTFDHVKANHPDAFQQNIIPFYTADKEKAAAWMRAKEGRQIVERHKLNGHSGEGIRIVEKEGELQDAPLYVEYVPKTQEYRVHVFQGKVIDIQRKARKKDVPDEKVNWKVRNLDGGFIYARDFAPEDLPADMTAKACATVDALGLDFGAVDIVFNKQRQTSYVLEVNTAPGLQGQTLDAYVKAFKEAGWDNEV